MSDIEAPRELALAPASTRIAAFTAAVAQLAETMDLAVVGFVTGSADEHAGRTGGVFVGTPEAWGNEPSACSLLTNAVHRINGAHGQLHIDGGGHP